MYSIHSNRMYTMFQSYLFQLPSDLLINLQLRIMCRLMSADGLSSGAPCHPSSQMVSLGQAQGIVGRQVFCTHRPRAREGDALTHRCYSTITQLLQRHTLLRESSWEMSSSWLSSLVHISCGDGRKEKKRSERMTNANASTSTNNHLWAN